MNTNKSTHICYFVKYIICILFINITIRNNIIINRNIMKNIIHITIPITVVPKFIFLKKLYHE